MLNQHSLEEIADIHNTWRYQKKSMKKELNRF
jgi:hypothetical protein